MSAGFKSFFAFWLGSFAAVSIAVKQPAGRHRKHRRKEYEPDVAKPEAIVPPVEDEEPPEPPEIEPFRVEPIYFDPPPPAPLGLPPVGIPVDLGLAAKAFDALRHAPEAQAKRLRQIAADDDEIIAWLTENAA